MPLLRNTDKKGRNNGFCLFVCLYGSFGGGFGGSTGFVCSACTDWTGCAGSSRVFGTCGEEEEEEADSVTAMSPSSSR